MAARIPWSPPAAVADAFEADLAVVGAGAAGLYTALCAARAGARVALVSRSPVPASASYWAQGGVAAALGADDSPRLHAEDTLVAGRGAARPSAVEVLCAEASGCVRDLESLGVRFDADRHGAIALGLEGGHSRRRVAHADGSATGRRITSSLSALAATDERVEVLEEATAAALRTREARCVGLRAELARAGSDRQPAVEIRARGVVLATGGAAALWERTTNPPGAIGAGLGLAEAAGAALADLELVQFHPTALACGDGRDGFLLTEALRGEGALLVNETGERFVDELAPRDEVALAIAAELKARAQAQVRLDMRSIDPRRFPNVAAALDESGLDPRREPVPVAPAAHYTMGGVATDLEGRSTVPGLYAVGECASTGLHGANRLASNSLAECLVFGRRAAAAALSESPLTAAGAGERVSGRTLEPPPATTRRALWRHAGLERNEEGLRILARDPSPLARAIAAAALARAESRGAHRRTDRPSADPDLDGQHFVVRPGEPPVPEPWG
ncbi:MAG TPA: FAD-dependent oxidoreductase [Thermoleophilaceae bacterium]|nr:FAD-dependent oxidoreductase [Thermoleophilaceae bacterium]